MGRFFSLLLTVAVLAFTCSWAGVLPSLSAGWAASHEAPSNDSAPAESVPLDEDENDVDDDFDDALLDHDWAHDERAIDQRAATLAGVDPSAGYLMELLRPPICG